MKLKFGKKLKKKVQRLSERKPKIKRSLTLTKYGRVFKLKKYK